MENKDQPLHASASEAITNNVRVEVESQFVPDRSQPFEQLWHFIYTVRITNEGDGEFEAVVSMAADGTAWLEGGEPFTPPWAV